MSTAEEVLTPQRVCELLGLPAPIDPPRPPAPWPGYATFWDPGRSILEVRRKHPPAFYRMDWYEGLAFAKATDVYRWRQIRIEPLKLGEVFAEQAKAAPNGDEIPSDRDVVTFLLIRFLATGERWPACRLRCRDLLPSGQRVVVGPFGDGGVEIASCGDSYRSPGVGLASANVPPPKR
jgi:hypothetical protein